MYFDWTYIVFILPAMIFALIASARVNSTFKTYSKQMSSRGMTGADAARAVLSSHGITNVSIEHVAGELTDHYDPKANVIRLSDNVYSSTSTAAIGVAAHEAGHAVQYAVGYAPIKFRVAIIPITNIGSKLSMPLFILGIILGAYSEVFFNLAYIGIFLFGFVTLFQLVTLPTEFNASSRALQSIKDTGILTSDEITGARKVLSAAAMTYVAALAASLAQLLRLIVIAGSRSNRRK